MVVQKNCENCGYFYSCKADDVKLQEYCSINPKVLGFCELWSGPIKNLCDCHGWVPR